ncbi:MULTISPECIES: RNA polymerase sigma factor [unclassified Pedobacter]|uniref:RNA polymerase sigma factor n=1 Tax=unclassified Pedobacter TaxID=2628915 RepID=UPI002035C6A6|nr:MULTISPECIES: RNA polymerase sigma-70 factor [unclassified Pedobacter]
MLKDGNHASFAEIYNRYGMVIYYKVNQMLRDEEAAKDLVQDLFMGLWTKPELIRADANLPGYLYIASRNKVFNLIQKGNTRNDFLKLISAYATEVSTETMDKLDARELMGIVAMEIEKLPPKMKKVFELSRLESLSHREIAEKLGISEQTVKAQVHNALVILKAKLGGYVSGVFFMLIWLDKIK